MLQIPVILVAASKLGVINHTLLTLNFLESVELTVLACVLNHCLAENIPAVATNAEALRRLAPVPLYVLPNLPNDRQSWDRAEFDELAALVLEQRKHQL